jgi:hypothetical protein
MNDYDSYYDNDWIVVYQTMNHDGKKLKNRIRYVRFRLESIQPYYVRGVMR